MYIFWHHFNPLFIFSCQINVTTSFIVEHDKIRIKSQLSLWTNLLYSSLCIKRKARMAQAHLDPDCWSGARNSTEAVAFVFSEERNDLCFLFVSLQLSFLVETARPTFPLRRGTNKNDTILQSTDGSRCSRRKTRSTWASYIAKKFFFHNLGNSARYFPRIIQPWYVQIATPRSAWNWISISVDINVVQLIKIDHNYR